MAKNIEIVDVGSENNEAPKEVEEIKEEPITNDKSTEVETNNIINEEENKENSPPDNNIDELPTKELRSKTY